MNDEQQQPETTVDSQAAASHGPDEDQGGTTTAGPGADQGAGAAHDRTDRAPTPPAPPQGRPPMDNDEDENEPESEPTPAEPDTSDLIAAARRRFREVDAKAHGPWENDAIIVAKMDDILLLLRRRADAIDLATSQD